MKLWRLTAFFILLREEGYGPVVEGRAGAQGVSLAGEQLLPFLQAQLLLMQPFLYEENLRHLDALLYTALDPVRICHCLSKFTSQHRIITLHGRFPRVVYFVRSS